MYDDLDDFGHGGVLLFEAHLCRHLYLFTSWKQNENIIVCLTMLMGVLTHSIFFCPSIKQQIILFTFSHFLPNPSLTSVFGEKRGITENKPCPLHMCKMHLGCSRDKKTQKAKTVYCFEQESKFTLPLL